MRSDCGDDLTRGAAFPRLDEPASLAVNYGFYALAMNLRALGVSGMTHETANRAASVYGILVLVVAVVAGRRRANDVTAASDLSRAREAQVWLALVTLASLRSPFVPDAYGMTGTLWLLTLLAAGTPRLTWQGTAAIVLLAVVFSTVLVPNIPPHPPVAVAVFSMMRTLLALSINVWVIPRRPPPADDGATEHRTLSAHDLADTAAPVG